ncbi:MAG: hypothetical protein WCN98_20155, partial [Verrucomicrobiaceae bacterium]
YWLDNALVRHRFTPVEAGAALGLTADEVSAAVKRLEAAKSPILVIGAGANRKVTGRMLLQFVEKTGIPFVTTQLGKGVIDETHHAIGRSKHNEIFSQQTHPARLAASCQILRNEKWNPVQPKKCARRGAGFDPDKRFIVGLREHTGILREFGGRSSSTAAFDWRL